MSNSLLNMIMAMPCAECGKGPCQSCFILSKNDGGPSLYFNYIPLCIKHYHEQDRIGTIAMINKYLNVKRFITQRGWSIDNNKLIHRDIKGAQ